MDVPGNANNDNPIVQTENSSGAGKENNNVKTRTGRTTSGRRKSASTTKDPRPRISTNTSENGDYYEDDYDDYELDEPFSTSEEEDDTTVAKPRPTLSLPMPRRRIRTLSGTVMPVGYSPVFGGPTMCLKCLEFFDLPRDTNSYTSHLMDKHQIVITDIELIVDLKRYIEYWRKRFTDGAPIDEIFPVITPTEEDPFHGKVEKYYLMSEKVKEDMQIRERLAMRRLEEVLSCQQRERRDKSFNRQCLFCRYRVKGNRAKLVHHLYTIHHLNLGSPDNLVFVNEYLDLLKKKLDNFQCLYCEKIFPDSVVLNEHMRKKGHREVNPKNNYYDKFYVINYLELGKKWLEVLAEDFEDPLPAFADSEDEEEEEVWNEWQEDNTEESEITIVCLFCDEAFQDSDKVVEHMKDSHKFDYHSVVQKCSWNFYQQLKFINFVRKQTHNHVCFVCDRNDLGSWQALRKHVADGEHLSSLPNEEKWDREEYLVPTYENDMLLSAITTTEEPENCGAAEGQEGTAKACGGSGRYVIIPEDPPEIGDIFQTEPALLDELR